MLALRAVAVPRSTRVGSGDVRDRARAAVCTSQARAGDHMTVLWDGRSMVRRGVDGAEAAWSVTTGLDAFLAGRGLSEVEAGRGGPRAVRWRRSAGDRSRAESAAISMG